MERLLGKILQPHTASSCCGRGCDVWIRGGCPRKGRDNHIHMSLLATGSVRKLNPDLFQPPLVQFSVMCGQCVPDGGRLLDRPVPVVMVVLIWVLRCPCSAFAGCRYDLEASTRPLGPVCTFYRGEKEPLLRGLISGRNESVFVKGCAQSPARRKKGSVSRDCS